MEIEARTHVIKQNSLPVKKKNILDGQTPEFQVVCCNKSAHVVNLCHWSRAPGLQKKQPNFGW